MPPFRAQSVEAAVRHRFLEQLQIRSDHGIVSLISQHRGRREVVEISRHRHLFARPIDERRVDRHAASVVGTDPTFRVGHVGVVTSRLPKLLLRALRAVGVPNL